MNRPLLRVLPAVPGLALLCVLGCAPGHERQGTEHAATMQSHPASAHEHAPAISAEDAWRRLEEGNARFANGRAHATADYSSRRAELAKGQHPFAIVVSCSDSRVGPEVVFDQGLGDLFVIRTAGHVVDDDALGSIEYAVEHLGSPLIVVLGHSRCGAVTAALEGGTPPGHIGALTTAIRPAVDSSRGQPGDPLDNAVRANVRRVAKQLRESGPILAEFVHDGRVRVIGAEYDLDSGRVNRLE